MPYLYLASSLDLSRRHYRVRPSPTAEAWLESKVHFAFESQFVVKLIAALSPSPTGVSLVCTVLNTIRSVILFRPAHQSIRFDSCLWSGVRLILRAFCAAYGVRAGRRSRRPHAAARPVSAAARRRLLGDGAAPARPLLSAHTRNRSPVRPRFAPTRKFSRHLFACLLSVTLFSLATTLESEPLARLTHSVLASQVSGALLRLIVWH